MKPMIPTIEKFKIDTVMHAAISIRGRRVKRDGHHAVCGKPLAGAMRVAPRDSIAKEAPISCGRCLDAVVAFTELIGGA